MWCSSRGAGRTAAWPWPCAPRGWRPSRTAGTTRAPRPGVGAAAAPAAAPPRPPLTEAPLAERSAASARKLSMDNSLQRPEALYEAPLLSASPILCKTIRKVVRTLKHSQHRRFSRTNRWCRAPRRPGPAAARAPGAGAPRGSRIARARRRAARAEGAPLSPAPEPAGSRDNELPRICKGRGVQTFHGVLALRNGTQYPVCGGAAET